jgi:16S rRNA (adenine1518-N6/adenine1519-N6)-dimethyltransferase
MPAEAVRAVDELRRPPGRRELLALLRAHDVRPSAALGQHFVADPNTVERIARLSRVGSGTRVVEVGPGLGSLTVALAATGASVVAVERDRRLLPLLERLVGPLGVRLVAADALRCDWASLLDAAEGAFGAGPTGRGASWSLVANLPYNIATPLLLRLLEEVPRIRSFLVMVQREVGERLVAAPGGRAYGAVSARVAYFAEARLVGGVPADVFVPRPRVASVLVRLDRRPLPPVAPETASYEELRALIRAGFATRRKTLGRALSAVVARAAFEAAGVDPRRRAEELGLEEWGKLAACQRALVSSLPPS